MGNTVQRKYISWFRIHLFESGQDTESSCKQSNKQDNEFKHFAEDCSHRQISKDVPENVKKPIEVRNHVPCT
jgi:hypothetical protein